MKYLKTTSIILIICSTSFWLNADDDESDEKSNSQAQVIRSLPETPAHASFKTECSSCHMLYHPSLLPERSWKKMMNELESHFGENAALDEKMKNDIEKYLILNSADHTNNRRAQKFLNSIPSHETPLRFSDSKYFKRKHDEISASTYKRKSIGSAANCLACHSTAEKGYYDEHGVRIPK